MLDDGKVVKAQSVVFYDKSSSEIGESLEESPGDVGGEERSTFDAGGSGEADESLYEEEEGTEDDKAGSNTSTGDT